MRYEILKDGEVVNAIVADNAFVESYCEKHGYTFVQLPDPAPRPETGPEDDSSVWAELDAAYREGVNSAYDE